MGRTIRYHMFKTAAVLVMFTGTAAAAFSLSAAGKTEDAGKGHFIEEEVHVTVPGMDDECRILWISDMHIFSYPNDPDVLEEHREDAQERHDIFRNAEGIDSCGNWEILSEQIDSFDADYAVFGADMIDYVSAANLDALQKGLEKVSVPWMYIRADHDYGRWYVDMGIKKMRRLHSKVAPRNKIWVERFADFTLVGLDNTTFAIADETLEEFREVCGEGKPVILCTHVPIDQRSKVSDTAAAEDSLAHASRESWGDRVLCWGEGDEYDTASSGTMEALADMIYAPDSPVIAVFAGHLHLTWDGNLTDTCTEHVFSAAYQDHVGMITVSG